MEPSRRVQIHQYNDPEILEFFNKHHAQYRLIGDHLFIIRSRGQDVAAGPGDWLRSAADGEVDVERGDYARRAHDVIRRVRQARRRRQGAAQHGPAEGTATNDLLESDTEQWKRRVEAEARDRLRRSIRHIAERR